MSEDRLLPLFVCVMVLADKTGKLHLHSTHCALQKDAEVFVQSFYKLNFMFKPRHKVKLHQQWSFAYLESKLCTPRELSIFSLTLKF